MGERSAASHAPLPCAPVLLAVTDHGRQIVACCCERSARAGVRPGMSIAHARALLPADLIIQPLQPQRDAAALRALGSWAMRYSPLVMVDESAHGLLIDITGCQHLFRGEHRLAKRAARDLHRLGFTVRIAVASTVGCAWAAAHYAKSSRVIISPGSERDAIEPLPVAALRVDLEIIAALDEVEVRRVGELLRLSRRSLAQRFGPQVLRRIDQALGAAGEAFIPLQPHSPILAEREFDGPVLQREAVEVAACELIDSLCEQLRCADLGVVRLEMTASVLDAPPGRIVLSFSSPTREPRHIRALLRPRLERVHLGFGAERITLRALRTERIEHGQHHAWGDSRADRHSRQRIGELIDALISRLGTDRVLRSTLIDMHLPESAFVMRPVPDVPTHNTFRGGARPAPPRPSLLHAPRRIIVTETHVRLRGEAMPITRRIGPERIAPPWWGRLRSSTSTRDYYRVRDERGRWSWIYCESETGQWFLHGQWA